MFDGTYAVEIDTSLGRKLGTLTFTPEGERLHIDVDAPVLGKKRAEGRLLSESSFIAEGTWKILVIGKVDFTIEGRLYGDDLALDVKTNEGNAQGVGIRL